MSIGLEKGRVIKITVITVEGESFTFNIAQGRDEARALAKFILKDGFNIDEKHQLRPGEEQYFPPASVYKVVIHKAKLENLEDEEKKIRMGEYISRMWGLIDEVKHAASRVKILCVKQQGLSLQKS